MTALAHSWEKKTEAVKRYMLLGNMRVVSEQLNVPYETLMDWKKQDWWVQLVEEIRKSRKTKQNNKLTDIIEDSLEIVQDRLQNGDFVLNNKTGEIVRKPVSLKDAAQVTNNLITRQLQLEELSDKMENRGDTMKETLTMLAKEFAKWSKKQDTNSVIDVEAKEVNDAVHDQRET